MAAICVTGTRECIGCMSCLENKIETKCPKCGCGIILGEDVRYFENEYYHDECLFNLVDERWPRREMPGRDE